MRYMRQVRKENFCRMESGEVKCKKKILFLNYNPRPMREMKSMLEYYKHRGGGYTSNTILYVPKYSVGKM